MLHYILYNDDLCLRKSISTNILDMSVNIQCGHFLFHNGHRTVFQFLDVTFDLVMNDRMKSTFIMVEIKIVWKIGSFMHVFKGISAKIAGKI